MMKGYFKADGDSLAMGILGASLGAMAGHRMKKNKGVGKMATEIGAAAGIAAALGVRAAVDPQLKNERA